MIQAYPETLAHRIAQGIGYMTHAEVELIHQLAPRVPPNATCVNIGCGAATSIIALLEYRPDLYLYSVDIDEYNGMSQLAQAGILSHIVKVIGDSKQVEWNGGPIDYLFVDGCHEEECIRGDIAAWLPRMKVGGIMLFHDYGSVNWDAVQRVVDEYAQAFDWKMLEHADTLIAFQLA